MKKKKKKPSDNDLRREIQFRALGEDEKPEELKDKMIVEGKAITYDEKTKLFTMDGEDYFEIIERGALKEADLSDVFLKYNHSDNFMVLARTRNKTLTIEEREDGVYIRAILANTSEGRDLYELIKRGDIDKMSFAFTEKDGLFDEKTRTWTVRNITKLYDVAAVTVPAYENTNIYAVRMSELENRKSELENLIKRKKRLLIKLQIGGK